MVLQIRKLSDHPHFFREILLMKTGSQQDYYTVANEAALDLSRCIPIFMQQFLYSKFVLPFLTQLLYTLSGAVTA